MARELIVYAKWGRGVIEVRVRGEMLALRTANLEAVFEPRTVLVEGRYASHRLLTDDRRARVYIDLANPLEPLEAKRIDLVGSRTLGLFEVRVTDLEFSRYLTVITPAGFMYEYLVISDDRLMVEASAKRKVFFEEEPFEKLIVYFA